MSQTKKKRGRPKKDDSLADTRKSASKTIRMRKRVHFTMELWSGFLSNDETAFIGLACEHYADALAEANGIQWRNIWHPHEGVRWLRIYAQIEDYPYTDDHEQRRAFVMLHRQFFYLGGEGQLAVNVPFVMALCGEMPDDATRWHKLDAFSRQRASALAPGLAMAEELKARELTPPQWPPVNP